MIRRYNSFLLKKLYFEMFHIGEGYLYGSTDFIYKLKSIQKMGGGLEKISRTIIDIIENESWIDDDSIKQNYFDVAKDEDKVSFVSQDKVLKSDFDEEENPSYPYMMPGRGDIKVGRIVNYIYKIIGEKITDKEIEEFVNAYKASSSDNDLQFKLVKGSEISKYYNSSKYFKETGTLGGSCMSEESKSTFNLYTDNKKKVQLLILVDSDDRIHGRALVWKMKESPCDAKYFMDRVYTNRDSDVIKFTNFARENKFMYKKFMNSHVETNVCFLYDGQEVFGEVQVKLDGDFNDYPFVDTLCFLDKKFTSLSNLPDKGDFMLHSVYGDCDNCDNCDGDIIRNYNSVVSFSSSKELCHECSAGHSLLKQKGIETKWNKKVSN
jgi:hypothetical protein